ncbi:hypothetical protein DL96DRAFT_1593519 [Flagelloscypha sp. PMI_526]|nr:hypothetical protein DL96DRAFT_1593519 [Flagelloscypha sp. PMI_526]
MQGAWSNRLRTTWRVGVLAFRLAPVTTSLVFGKCVHEVRRLRSYLASPPTVPTIDAVEQGSHEPDVPASVTVTNTQQTPYPSGNRISQRHRIPPLTVRKSSKGDPDFVVPEQLGIIPDMEKYTMRRNLLHVLATTNSPEEAWHVYTLLQDLSQQACSVPLVPVGPFISFAHLRRLFRLLSRQTPKTRTGFMRILNLLTSIRARNGDIRLYEWNTLADFAGKGWHRARPEDFRLSLGILEDMIQGLSPGYNNAIRAETPLPLKTASNPVEPDIVTHTTLLNIGVSTLDATSITRAYSLLSASGLRPDRVTFLVILKHYVFLNDLPKAREVMEKMHRLGLELGMDAVNACLLLYTRTDRLDILDSVWQILRWRVEFEHYISTSPWAAREDWHKVDSFEISSKDYLPQDVRQTARQAFVLAEELAQTEHLHFHPAMKPNRITYTTVIQAFAYHGHFQPMLQAFLTFLRSPNEEFGASLSRGNLTPEPYQPTLSIFRSLFLSFRKHSPGPIGQHPHYDDDWTLANLEHLFDAFLDFEFDVNDKLTKVVVFWIMSAFDKTSGRDEAVMLSVWERLEEKFGERMPIYGSGHRLARLRTWLASVRAQFESDQV